MEALSNAVSAINGVVWGPLMLVLILGTGLFLQAGLKVMPIRKLGFGFSLLWKGRTPPAGGKGEISPFNALMTSLSATIGTGALGMISARPCAASTVLHVTRTMSAPAPARADRSSRCRRRIRGRGRR